MMKLLGLLLILLAQGARSQEAPVCDSRCTTTCDPAGSCVCTPNNGIELVFKGGQFCDQLSHYCSQTAGDPFYCVDNGGNTTCGTADATPTCICQPGFAGVKCQLQGLPCAIGYCYNNATCTSSGMCDCPPEWRGDAICTITTEEAASKGGSGIKWWGVLLITGAVVAAVSVGVAFGYQKYKERTEGVSRFNELKKSQMRGRAESDDDEYDSDPYEDEVAGNNNSKNKKNKAATTAATAQP